MAAEFVLDPDAERDVLEAYSWYERSSAEAGEDFLRRVDACLEAIRRSPKMHRLVFGENVRRALIRKYPYAIYYSYDGTVVNVFCIVHNSRDPSHWKSRLP